MNNSELFALAMSRAAEDRMSCLEYIRSQIEEQLRFEDVYFDIARQLVADSDNDCRWQAIIVLGKFIPTRHHDIWEVLCEHGIGADDDMIDALATVLLEHLLDEHYDVYYPKVAAFIDKQDRNIDKMLERCWRFNQNNDEWDRILELRKKIERH